MPEAELEQLDSQPLAPCPLQPSSCILDTVEYFSIA